MKADVKARLEDGPDPAKPGGNRDALQVSSRRLHQVTLEVSLMFQVLSSSLPSLLAALLYRGYVASPVGEPLTLRYLRGGRADWS